VASVAGSADSKHATVVFSEPVTTSSAQNVNNYKINNLTVTAAVLNTNDNLRVRQEISYTFVALKLAWGKARGKECIRSDTRPTE